MDRCVHSLKTMPNLEEILDKVEKSLADDLVPVEIFNDDQVFKAEMEKIFAKNWVFVAHMTEIPNPGDFVLRRVGLDKVIVTKDTTGVIRVMSNYCRHRGAEVCQRDKGNTHFHTCPYHGWAFKDDGDFVGAPHMEEAYGRDFDKKKWGLIQAPRVEVYQGFIFTSLSADVAPLKEHLGGAAWMLDAIVGLHPDGMKVIAAPERYRCRGDWKTAAENFSGDVYHVDFAHWSTEAINVAQGLGGTCEWGRSYELGNGHNFVGHEWTSRIGPEFTLWGYDPETAKNFDLSKLDDTQRMMVTHKPPTVGTIFPNLSFIRFALSTEPGGKMIVVTSFRQWQPIGPGEFELWNWQFAWNFQTEEEIAKIYAAAQFTFGSAGIFEQDDTVMWEGLAGAGKSTWMRMVGMELHYQQGRGTDVDQSPDPTWTGPGVHRRTGYGEYRQLAFYRHWLKTMRANGGANQEI